MAPRFESKDGKIVIETAVVTEAARLRAEGFRETKARTKAVRAQEASSAPGTTSTPAASTTASATTTKSK